MDSFDDEIDEYMTSCRLRKQAIRQAASHRMNIMWAKKAIRKLFEEYDHWERIAIETGNVNNVVLSRNPFDSYVFEYLEAEEDELEIMKAEINVELDNWHLGYIFNQ